MNLVTCCWMLRWFLPKATPWGSQGLHFVLRVRLSCKRLRSAPGIWRRMQSSRCTYILDRRRREVWWLEPAGDESYRAEDVFAVTSRACRSLRLSTRT